MSDLASDMAALPARSLAREDQADWPDQVHLGLTGRAWLRIGIIALLMIALFWPNLRRLFLKTNPFTGEANWGHSFFVPLIGLYYLYLNREPLLKAKVHPGWLGLPIMLGGLLLFAYGIWPGQNDFVKDFGMIVTLFGVVALLCGWQVMKIAWFPIVFLIAALPWPGLVYSWVALPLQKIAATAAAFVMKISGVEAARIGTKIVITADITNPRVLNVAEACAGMKSLMTFITVGGAIGFLSAHPLWQKLFIAASAVPIAIFCNMVRVAGQGLLDHYVSHQLSESFAHQFVGMIMLIPAFFLLLLVGWILDNLFIEEVDKRKLAPVGASAPAPAQPATPKRLVAAVEAAPRPAPAPPAPAPISKPAAPLPKPAAPSQKPAAPKAKPAPAAPAPAAHAADQMAEATRRMMSAGSQRRSRPPARPAPPAPPQKKEGA